MQHIDIIIKNGYTVTINPEMEIIKHGAIAIEKGKYLRSEPMKTLRKITKAIK